MPFGYLRASWIKYALCLFSVFFFYYIWFPSCFLRFRLNHLEFPAAGEPVPVAVTLNGWTRGGERKEGGTDREREAWWRDLGVCREQKSDRWREKQRDLVEVSPGSSHVIGSQQQFVFLQQTLTTEFKLLTAEEIVWYLCCMWFLQRSQPVESDLVTDAALFSFISWFNCYSFYVYIILRRLNETRHELF